MVTRRQSQLATRLQRLAAQSLLGHAWPQLLTVTRATISIDARQSTIYIAGWNDLDESYQKQARRLIIARISQESQSKYSPRVTIEAETALDHASHIDTLLSSD